MKNDLILKNVESNKSILNVAKNAANYIKSFDEILGICIDISVKDKYGWHTLAQRLFKNGSIHIKIK